MTEQYRTLQNSTEHTEHTEQQQATRPNNGQVQQKQPQPETVTSSNTGAKEAHPIYP